VPVGASTEHEGQAIPTPAGAPGRLPSVGCRLPTLGQ
jgi:hypothetical protein